MAADLDRLLATVAAHDGYEVIRLRRGQKKPDALDGEAPTRTRS